MIPIVADRRSKKIKAGLSCNVKKKRYSKVKKTNIQFNVVPPIKQIVCTFTREGRNFIRTLREYNKKYLHFTLKSYEPLMAAKNSEPLWLSFSHEFLT